MKGIVFLIRNYSMYCGRWAFIKKKVLVALQNVKWSPVRFTSIISFSQCLLIHHCQWLRSDWHGNVGISRLLQDASVKSSYSWTQTMDWEQEVQRQEKMLRSSSMHRRYTATITVDRTWFTTATRDEEQKPNGKGQSALCWSFAPMRECWALHIIEEHNAVTFLSFIQRWKISIPSCWKTFWKLHGI